MTKSKIVMGSHNKRKQNSPLCQIISCNIHIVGWVCFQILGQKKEIRINIHHWLAISWRSIPDCFGVDSSPEFWNRHLLIQLCTLSSHLSTYSILIKLQLIFSWSYPHGRLGWRRLRREASLVVIHNPNTPTFVSGWVSNPDSFGLITGLKAPSPPPIPTQTMEYRLLEHNHEFSLSLKMYVSDPCSLQRMTLGTLISK